MTPLREALLKKVTPTLKTIHQKLTIRNATTTEARSRFKSVLTIVDI